MTAAWLPAGSAGQGRWEEMPPTSLAELIERPAWMANAACRGYGPDKFFPERGETLRYARAVCERCPVADECRQYAVENREAFGVWGGTSEAQRKRERGPDAPTPPKQGPPTNVRERQERVAEMRRQGYSMRLIASYVGVTYERVRLDLLELGVESPRLILGRNGREYRI